MNNMKLNTAINQYSQSILPTKSLNYQKALRSQFRHWSTHLGEYRLSRITPQLVQDHLPDGSPATRNRYVSALSVVYGECGDQNPCRSIKRGKEIWRVRFLSDQEKIALLDACRRSRSKILYPVVILALWTGLRKMEILKLEWNRVDLHRGLIHLIETKGGRPRTIPIMGHALELISQLPRTSRYIFPTRTGEYRRHLADCWYPMIRSAGIEDLTFHHLRHHFASTLALQGVPLYDISVLLGHKNISQTQRYAHLSVGHLRGVLAGLDNHLFGGAP